MILLGIFVAPESFTPWINSEQSGVAGRIPTGGRSPQERPAPGRQLEIQLGIHVYSTYLMCTEVLVVLVLHIVRGSSHVGLQMLKSEQSIPF